ncbi:MAG: RsmF rRNA methyltransferase first C-terminal domain-containing protein [Lachnospiraceae bacterium]|nr:RsmF rRNA methyltransferase first C-terminal domain-containing protein [Lachnospiraceae bacterium]
MSPKDRLPLSFVERMKAQLGGESERFLDSYEEEPWAGIRIHTGKLPVREAEKKLPFIQQRMPWTENGFYVDKDAPASGHPWYYAGLYYIQEPSAMLPASVLPVEPGDRVLDLCAAPGGKATELALSLGGSGLLVANDASASRARALLKNLTVWGAPNICVTAETPQRLLESFGCFFDKILVDAPCSGEGMFRKDSNLIGFWEQKDPADYAPLQKEILSCAVQMLKPGGMLVYSTCTFSEEEDEAVVADALACYPELELMQPKLQEGFSCGRALPGVNCDAGQSPLVRCVRIYPHRVKGEGHFLALMRKRTIESGAEQPYIAQPGAAPLLGKFPAHRGKYGDADAIPDEIREFLSQITSARVAAIEKMYRYRQLGEQCLFVPPDPLPEGIRYLRTGLLLGTLRRGRFEPSQALAMLLDSTGFPAVLNLPVQDARVMRYLKGETLELSREEARTLRQKAPSDRGPDRDRKAQLMPDNTRQEKRSGSGQEDRFGKPGGSGQEDSSGMRGGSGQGHRFGKPGGSGRKMVSKRMEDGGGKASTQPWVLVCADGYALGWGRLTGSQLKNKYYPGWRMQ